MRLWCAVPTSDKFTVHSSAVVIRQARPAQNIGLCSVLYFCVVKSAFYDEGGLQGRGRRPPTTVGVRKLG